MDHLPPLRGSSTAPLKVCFYAKYNYDGGGIPDFPSRCGFKFEAHTQDQEMNSAFLQAWLYFGTLAEVLRVYDIPLVTSDFALEQSNDAPALSTRYLQDYLAAWIVRASQENGAILEKDRYEYRVRMMGQSIGSKAGAYYNESILRKRAPVQSREPSKPPDATAFTERRAARIHQVLNEVAATLYDFGSTATLVDDSVWDSILILCSTLQNAAYYAYRSFDFKFKFVKLFDKVAARQLDGIFWNNGWCPREKKIIHDMAEGDNNVLFLSAQLSRWDDTSRHQNCDSKMCFAYQVDNSTYRTRHVQDNCQCEFIGFGKTENGIESLISRAVNQIPNTRLSLPTVPMITYTGVGIQIMDISLLSSAVNRFKVPIGRPYLAFSHVWGHGLGNPKANDLPRCQIERLQVSLPVLLPCSAGVISDSCADQNFFTLFSFGFASLAPLIIG